jgi:hypothetical protein
MSSALDRTVPGEPSPRPADPEAAPPPSQTPSAFRSWMAIPLVLILLAALTVVGFTLVAPLLEGGGGSPGDIGEETGPRAVRIVAAESYDPDGDGSEHDDTLSEAHDGDPSTAWTTEGYNSPDLDKAGVGIVFDLGNPRSIGSLSLQTESPGFTFSVFSGDAPDTFDLDAPLPSGGQTSFTAEDGMELTFEPVRTRYVLIWITELVEHDGFRAVVNEAQIFVAGG